MQSLAKNADLLLVFCSTLLLQCEFKLNSLDCGGEGADLLS